ncbi:MAG: hypothetical protein DSY47_02590 [Hydrogenothermus sp.]|nr:MAG: hypothetical protein DSY47_02590 [Hydrogenothermus sp.]
MNKKAEKPVTIRDLDAELWADFKNLVEKLSIKEGKRITIAEAVEEALKMYMDKYLPKIKK